jgi:hypothetical protein
VIKDPRRHHPGTPSSILPADALFQIVPDGLSYDGQPFDEEEGDQADPAIATAPLAKTHRRFSLTS